MPESVLTILKFCFLALLYLFLFRVVRVVVKEMRAPAPVPDQPAAPPSAAPLPASRPAKPAKGRGPGRLKILEPPARHGETYDLAQEVTVGRGGGCAIVLADDTFVSTVHARVFRRDGAVYVEDLGSRNGTLLNGEPLVHAAQLRRGDHVQFGQTVAEAVR
ncbi:MAG TPA: FHA domain-containing protein [Acidimicrobiia bacterium]